MTKPRRRLMEGRRSAHPLLVGMAVGMVLTGLILAMVAGDPGSNADVASELPGTSPPNGPGADDATRPAAPGSADDGGGRPHTEPGTDPAAPGTSGSPGGTPDAASMSDPELVGAGAEGAVTDAGVTAESIRVGFLLADLASASRVGAQSGLSVEESKRVVQSYVDEINASGGIQGRLIEAAYARWDPLNEQSQRAACLALTEDARVFAVIGGLNSAAATACITHEHDTPNVATVSNTPDSLYARSRTRLITLFPRGSRMMANWAFELDRLGVLAGNKIGIVADERTDPGGSTAQSLSTALRQQGHDVAHISRLSNDQSTGASQIPVEIQRMRRAGVEVVLLLSTTLYSTQFVQTAESQLWSPAYATSDYSSMHIDTTNQNMPRSYDGAVNVTASRWASHRDGSPEPAPVAACREIYERRSGRSMPAPGTDGHYGAMLMCDAVRIFEAAARAAGTTLTRDRFGAATESLGELRPTAAVAGGAFHAGKLDLADVVRIQRWRYDCRCWQPASGFRPSRS